MNEAKEHSSSLDSSMQNLEIRRMSFEELKLVMDWAKNEGWNPGKYDYVGYYDQNPEGFLLLSLNDQPIGSISIVKHRTNFAFIGLFIIVPEFRGKGYGTHLWNHALNELKTFSCIGLYSVPQQKTRYNSSGFLTQFSVKRREIKELPSTQSNNNELEAINQGNLNLLSNYDQDIWGSSRAPFFSALIQKTEGYHGFISFDETTREVNGYGIARPCQEGYRVSLYAKSFETAQELASHLLSQLNPGTKVIFDIPDRNPFSNAFSEYFHLKLIESACTEAMFKGERSADESSKNCYGLLSQELG